MKGKKNDDKAAYSNVMIDLAILAGRPYNLTGAV